DLLVALAGIETAEQHLGARAHGDAQSPEREPRGEASAHDLVVEEQRGVLGFVLDRLALEPSAQAPGGRERHLALERAVFLPEVVAARAREADRATPLGDPLERQRPPPGQVEAQMPFDRMLVVVALAGVGEHAGRETIA